MEKTRNINRMNGLIKVIESTLKELGNEVSKEKLQENSEIEMLTYEFTAGVNNEPVLSSTYFLPMVSDDTDTLYLINSLTIRDDIEDAEMKATMLQALNLVNFYVPYSGSFVMDGELEVISFRTTIHIHEGLDDIGATQYVLKELSSAVGIVGIYMSAINALAERRIDWESFVGIIDAYSRKE